MTTTCPTDLSAHDAEHRTVLELWRRNLPESTKKRYGWLYENGPADVFVLRDDQAEPIGSVGLMRREVFVSGRPTATGQAVDMRAANRGMSIATQVVGS